MAAKRKAKFKVGQVVIFEKSGGRFVKVRYVDKNSAGNAIYCVHEGQEIVGWIAERNLRPLTAREAENVYRMGYGAGWKAHRRLVTAGQRFGEMGKAGKRKAVRRGD